jgi:hypothetical protein
MPTYYVRKTGNNGNTGLSPAQAWLTLDYAAGMVAAGDTVYIGAGTYRESVTLDTSGSSGNPIRWVADINGQETGDAGLVVVTTNADEVGTGGVGSVLLLNGKTYNEFYFIIFGPAGSNAADYTIQGLAANCNYEGILFESCVMLAPIDNGNYTININYKVPGAISGNKPKCNACVIVGSSFVTYEAMAAGDVACGWGFENCFLFSEGGLYTLEIDGPSTSTNGITGYAVVNCILSGGTTTPIYIADQFNAGTTGVIANNLFLNSTSNYNIVADGGTWTVTDNQGTSETVQTGVTKNVGWLLGFMVDPILQRFYGWNPYRAFEPVWDKVGSGFKSAMVDLGNATYAPATDIYNEARPMCRADDVGAAEARARAEHEVGTVRTGSHSAAIKGAGYHDMLLPVDAVATTVSVYGRYDSNYTGNLPQLWVMEIPGVGGDQVDTMTGAADNWEQLSCTFTPAIAGFVRVRLYSRDTSATGITFFDDLAVS